MISLLLLKLTAFSQIDTGNSQKCFPIPIVKLIIKDLISGDSAKAQLKLTELQLNETEKKVNLKDSVITTLRAKESNYLSQIEFEKEKYRIIENYSNKLEVDLKKEKVKNKFNSVLSKGVILVLTVLFITK